MRLVKIMKTVCPQCTLLDILLKSGGITVDEVHNVDHEPELIEQYGIMGTPTLLFIDNNGNELERVVGATGLSPEIIKQKVEKWSQ
ncbi:thioredoxin family protein [Weizmannia sp. CD-2023]|uniref:thioredoxin family protein n=1 Tax=Heyndrickxia TaxID=2837504 RepID=UPI002E1E5B87|nr:thioredoxin family protein [Weizmannia sp. CD-2023]MED4899777.1 thioredoxin family protein [Weizmannia sp. CD-2023]